MAEFSTNIIAPDASYVGKPGQLDSAASFGEKRLSAADIIAECAAQLRGFFLEHSQPRDLASELASEQIRIGDAWTAPEGETHANTSLPQKDFSAIVDRLYRLTSIHRPSWYEELDETLSSLTELAQDWSGEGSERFSDDALNWSRMFFSKFGSLFPTKPFVYPSNRGELVAECEINYGKLTLIVGRTNLVVFAAKSTGTFSRVVQIWKESYGRVTSNIEGAVAYLQLP